MPLKLFIFRRITLALIALNLGLILQACEQEISLNKEFKTWGYAQNPARYTKNQIISPNTHNFTGKDAQFSIAPALPSGFSFSSTTGTITGIHLGNTFFKQDYVVTATNSAGSTQAPVQIDFVDVAPQIYYSALPIGYRNQIFPSQLPIVSGGAVVLYTVTPNLPSGLLLNSITGEISGTPTQALEEGAAFTITASNSGGTASAPVFISIYDIPPALAYSPASLVITKKSVMAAAVPRNSGGVATQFYITPSLPAGLSFNTRTGEISGTPTVLQVPAVSHHITATNKGGANSTDFSIQVNDFAPLFSYAPAASYTRGGSLAIAPTLNANGGAVLNYTASGLPAGLAINSASGVISGIPTALSSGTTVQVTGTNSGGSLTASLSIVIIDVAVKISYVPNDLTFTKGLMGSGPAPTIVGGAVDSYSSTALPPGLALDATSGVISGVPTTLQTATLVSITAHNSAGAYTTQISFRVVDVAPNSLHYSSNPASYTVGHLIADNILTAGGGPVVQYSITSGGLPSGLIFDSSSGRISGTPTSNYSGSTVVSATNSGGSASVSLALNVTTCAVTSCSAVDSCGAGETGSVSHTGITNCGTPCTKDFQCGYTCHCVTPNYSYGQVLFNSWCDIGWWWNGPSAGDTKTWEMGWCDNHQDSSYPFPNTSMDGTRCYGEVNFLVFKDHPWHAQPGDYIAKDAGTIKCKPITHSCTAVSCTTSY